MSGTRQGVPARTVLRGALRQHFGPRGQAKKAFPDQAAAAVFAADLNTRPAASKRRPYWAYQCEECGQWHVGRKAAQ